LGKANHKPTGARTKTTIRFDRMDEGESQTSKDQEGGSSEAE